MHLMVRSKKFAIKIAQCQRAKSVWRSNNPSIVIDVRGLGDKDSCAFSKTIRNSTSFQENSVSIKEELLTQTTGTPLGTVRNSVRARNRIFFQSKGVVKLSLINSPTDVIRSMLDISQNIFVLVMSRAFHACWENGFPILTKSSS